MPQPSTPRVESADKGVAVPVWDLAVRVGHWALVLLIALSWTTGTLGALSWHRWSGYAVLILVLFRVYWGFTGSSPARFSNFLRGPRAVWTHSKTLFSPLPDTHTIGHTPLGGWSILAMLLLLVLQGALGLFAVDVDGIESGPLSDLVSFETGRQLATWHGKVVNILLVLIALHVTAILHYWLYKRVNLVAAMVSGLKHLPPGTPPPVAHRIFWRAMIGLVGAALLVLTVVTRLHL